MDKDYRLGQGFFECSQRVRPDSQQKLLAILGDLAGPDADIISAFRLLFGNSLYASLFLERRAINLAELASLVSIAQESLSPLLAKRAESFVRGYFSVIADGSTPMPLPLPPVSPRPPLHGRVDWSGVGAVGSSIVDDESTVFADEEPPSRHASTYNTPREGQAIGKSGVAASARLRPVLFSIFLILFGIAVFRVPAICEPFGLCDKKDDPGSKVPKWPRSGELKNGNRTDGPPSPVPQSQPEASPSPPPPRATVPVRPQPAAPTPMPTTAPQPASAPLRDEPLW